MTANGWLRASAQKIIWGISASSVSPPCGRSFGLTIRSERSCACFSSRSQSVPFCWIREFIFQLLMTSSDTRKVERAQIYSLTGKISGVQLRSREKELLGVPVIMNALHTVHWNSHQSAMSICNHVPARMIAEDLQVSLI